MLLGEGVCFFFPSNINLKILQAQLYLNLQRMGGREKLVQPIFKIYI